MNTGRNHNLHLQQIWSNEPRLQGMCRSHGFFRVNRRTVLPEKSRKRFESPRSAEPVDLAEPSRKPINCRGTLETSMLAPMPQTNRPTALPNSREAARPPRSARLANWLGNARRQPAVRDAISAEKRPCNCYQPQICQRWQTLHDRHNRPAPVRPVHGLNLSRVVLSDHFTTEA